MSTDEGDFLKRWSRRKREAAKAPQPKAPEAKAEQLPPIDSLTFDSDFSQFLRANVEESVKRAALKKLLHDPRFNVMDGLDTYIDDYSKDDPIPEEMLKRLEHAKDILFGPKEEVAQAEAKEQTAKEETAKKDGDPGQDA